MNIFWHPLIAQTPQPICLTQEITVLVRPCLILHRTLLDWVQSGDLREFHL